MNNHLNAVTDYGADPTGAADSTGALQNAIDAGLARRLSVYIPSGLYHISAPLIVGAPYSLAKAVSGWELHGDGRGTGTKSGTTILLRGSGFHAIMELNSSLWRFCKVKGLSLLAMTQGGAANGVLLNSTEYSGHAIQDVNVGGVGNAFAILVGTGGNGEFVHFENCQGLHVDRFFYSNAGQAYVQRFDHCGGQLNAGGTWFELEMPNGGGGLIVTDFNGTGSQRNGISNTTLLRDAGSSSPITFIGGRVEHVTKLLSNTGGSPDNGKPVLIEGMELTVDFDPSNLANSLPEAFTSTANADLVAVRSCHFDTANPSCTFPVHAGAGWGTVTFDHCKWTGFAQPPHIVTSGYDEFQKIQFRDCRCDASNALDRPIPFERLLEVGRTTPRPEELHAESLWVSAGTPGNLLHAPLISILDVAAKAPDAPWVAFGRTLTVASAAGPSGARRIRIAPGSGIYQDIREVDLSSRARARGYDGVWLNTVAYKGKFLGIGGAEATISLVDSESGQIYDQLRLGAGGPIATPVYVTLVACVKQRLTESFVRLKIENTDASKALLIEPRWQFVCADPV